MTAPEPVPTASTAAASRARAFVVLMGVVALFGDMTYEGARGVIGPYLGALGASATMIGFAAGLGELLGYGLRLATGWLADRTRAYWPLVITGYAINLVAVPGLALVGRWELGIALLLLERIGKAIRSPARSTLVSYAASEVGAGWSFGLEEALDQIGAVLGPLLVGAAMWMRAGAPVVDTYRIAFLVLLVPVVLNLLLVLSARIRYPRPEALASESTPPPSAELRGTFRQYVLACALLALGFADWALVALHAVRSELVGTPTLPFLYALVMGVDAVAALGFGTAFDRAGLRVLAIATACSAGLAPLVFLAPSWPVLVLGAALWGIGMGAQDSVFKAAVATMVPKEARGRAYGIFFAVFGLAWWLGSTAMGWLYDHSRIGLVALSVVTQLGAALWLLVLHRRIQPVAPT